MNKPYLSTIRIKTVFIIAYYFGMRINFLSCLAHPKGYLIFRNQKRGRNYLKFHPLFDFIPKASDFYNHRSFLDSFLNDNPPKQLLFQRFY
jgi:hypothetical protein